MSLKNADRVKESTTTAGTGTLNLAGTTTGYSTFLAAIGNGNTCPYLIDDGAGNWELTWGVIASGTPNTLTRGTLINSSTGSRINFGAGTKTVAIVNAQELLLWPAASPVLADTTIASAATTDLGTSTTLSVVISGTTGITSFGTQPYALRYIRFSGTSLVLTHNATSLILPTGANIQTAAGDTCVAQSDGSGNWRVISYTPVGGTLQSTFSSVALTASFAQVATLSIPPGKWEVTAALQSRAATALDIRGAISTTTASNTGTVSGVTDFSNGPYSTSGIASLVMPTSEITVTTTTAYYFNAKADTSVGGFSGIFRAKRIL